MQWIKRNLFFVISCAIAVALMVAAGVFAVSKYNEDQAIQEELNQQVAEAQRIAGSPVFPNAENIASLKKEAERLKEARAGLVERFAQLPVLPKVDDQGFKAVLEKSISGLVSGAKAANVAIPDKYDFTFQKHRKLFQFTPGSTDPWMIQLLDIKAICDVLYRAKVNALDAIQRSAISVDDGGGEEFVTFGVTTNQMGTSFWPYAIKFRSFSGELAAALDGFAQSTNFIIVKSINVTPSSVPLPALASPVSAPQPRMLYQPPPLQSAVPIARANTAPAEMLPDARYGSSRPSTPGPAPAVMPGKPTAASAATVLSERPLQVTMLVQVVRLNKQE